MADFKGTDACVLFGSGYLANTGIVATLAGEGDVVFSDALNHASIVDGCRLARAQTFVYDHCDLDHLEWGLQEAGGRGALTSPTACSRWTATSRRSPRSPSSPPSTTPA